jgi:hypothetical protein
MLPECNVMKRWFIFFVFLILGAHVAGAESIITVEVNESGNANWTMEKRIPLTKPEINEWEGLIKSGQNLSRYRDIAEFKDMMNLFIGSAQNFSNRSMKVEKFNISYDTVETMSGGFGIIRYSFWLMNFSHTDSDKIFIGDAFSEGLVLSTDSLLVVKIPDAYDVKSVSPNFDRREGNRLIWEGSLYHSFGKGEPSLVLQRTWGISHISGTSSMLPVILVPLVILVAGALIFWKRRQSRYQVESDSTQIQVTETETEPPVPIPYPEEDLGDEKMIEQFLIRSGGQAYQSDIVKESRLSKSKISMVLAKMKEDGKILKVKKGKENLIRLVRKSS